MGIRLTATFLDEISDDIPHQNWGVEEWDRDFAAMKETGIDTVVMIRCGARKFIAYPSKILMEEEGCHEPPVDLVDMFLSLAEKYGMRYFFGTYTRRKNGENTAEEIERSWDQERRLIDEAWERYGHRKAFAGWYLAKEILYREPAVVAEFRRYGEHCKKISGNLPILISPAMWGRKAWDPNDPNARDLDFRAHEQMWDEIMGEIAGLVDIIAFQDGHVTYEELPEVLRINKRLVRVVCNVCADRSERLALLVRHIDHSGLTARRIGVLRLYRRRFLLGVIRFFRLGRRDRLGLRVILRRSADLVFLEHEAIDAAADDHHQNDHDRHNDFCVFLHMNASLCIAARFLSCIYIIPQRH